MELLFSGILGRFSEPHKNISTGSSLRALFSCTFHFFRHGLVAANQRNPTKIFQKNACWFEVKCVIYSYSINVILIEHDWAHMCALLSIFFSIQKNCYTLFFYILYFLFFGVLSTILIRTSSTQYDYISFSVTLDLRTIVKRLYRVICFENL